MKLGSSRFSFPESCLKKIKLIMLTSGFITLGSLQLLMANPEAPPHAAEATKVTEPVKADEKTVEATKAADVTKPAEPAKTEEKAAESVEDPSTEELAAELASFTAEIQKLEDSENL